jgi:Uma2 family endonuclease
MGTTTGLITFEELERLPNVPGKRELIDGEVLELPPAKRKHNENAEQFFLALVQATEAARLQSKSIFGRPHIGMGYRVMRNPDSWLVPDVSIAHADQPGEDYLEGAPLLAVEIISPSNGAEEIERKRKLYLEHGGVEVWVVYPMMKSVWVFRAGHAQEFTDAPHSEIIPGLRLALDPLLA